MNFKQTIKYENFEGFSKNQHFSQHNIKLNTRSYRVHTIGHLIGLHINIYIYHSISCFLLLILIGKTITVGLQPLQCQMPSQNILNSFYKSFFFTEYCNVCSFDVSIEVNVSTELKYIFHPFHSKCKHWMITSSFQIFSKMSNLFRIQSDVVLHIFLKL